MSTKRLVIVFSFLIKKILAPNWIKINRQTVCGIICIEFSFGSQMKAAIRKCQWQLHSVHSHKNYISIDVVFSVIDINISSSAVHLGRSSKLGHILTLIMGIFGTDSHSYWWIGDIVSLYLCMLFQRIVIFVVFLCMSSLIFWLLFANDVNRIDYMK